MKHGIGATITNRQPPVPRPLADWLASVSTVDGVYAVDSRQRVIYWSASAEQILGHAPEDVVGHPCYEVVGGRDSRNYRFCRRDCPVLINARRGRPTRDYDILVRTRDGHDRWINISVLVFRGSDPRSSVVLHVFRDVTRRRRIEGLACKAVAALREVVTPDEEADALDDDPSPTPTPLLTRRETDVLRLLACGMGTNEIGERLGVSPVTARNHITNVLTKLGAANRLQGIVYASRRGLI